MYWFFGCFISSNFKSTTKLICLTRQIYKNVLARFSSIVDHFLVYDIGRLNNKKQSVILWRWGGGVKNVILRMVCLNGFYTKSFDKNLKVGIPCPLKCLAYNNIVLLHGSEIPYNTERFDNK